MPIDIRYAVRPRSRSLLAGEVMDLFGLSPEEPPHVVAEGFELTIPAGAVVLITGPSGSGKSSLLRALGQRENALDLAGLPLPETPLIDALPGTLDERLAALAAAGLGEARLMLRTPSELSDGQRYRFRIAFGLTQNAAFLMLDEFGAVLDRTLAKVLAFNLRKAATRTGIGAICATTHEDLADDLNPDIHIRCQGDGIIDVEHREVKKKRISFGAELWLSDGTRRDWPHFARWHYRSHHLAYTRRVILLWHGEIPIGIIVFGTPAASLGLRSRYFGLKNPRSGLGLQSLNAQLWLLQRIVLHPTYRGAGIASDFMRRACELCDIDWIETLTAMGRANPVFEHAGFQRVGIVKRSSSANGAYGSRAKLSAETRGKSRYSEPVYYVFDNRGRMKQ